MNTLASWNLGQGDDIAPGLVAMKHLGGGTAFEAYLAFDERLYAPVVVKVVRPDQLEDTEVLANVDREIEMLRRLDHPAVVRCFAASTDGPRPYVVLENIDGPNLSSLLRAHGPLPLQQALPLGIELASALHYLCGVGVCHLDLKPSNVIMGAPARLIDLSVAMDAKTARDLDYPVGSDEYMAPEQCDPTLRGGVGVEADMWGLGATMFKALAGYRAFDQPSDLVRWPQLVDEPYALPEQVPPDLDDLIVRCLDQDPARRPLPIDFAGELEPMMARLPKVRLSGFKVTL